MARMQQHRVADAVRDEIRDGIAEYEENKKLAVAQRRRDLVISLCGTVLRGGFAPARLPPAGCDGIPSIIRRGPHNTPIYLN